MEVQNFKLDIETELRFEVEDAHDTAILTLEDGMAEIFGSELVPKQEYTFKGGAKVAVFTWHGCKLKLKAKPKSGYIAAKTPMVMYLNCHCALEVMRSEAAEKNEFGPITMVVGPMDVGKSTLARILLNYAVRTSRARHRPIFVDLDVGQGSIGIPGTIGAMVIERPASADGDFNFSQAAPLVYHYGSADLGDNSQFMKIIVSQLATVIRSRLEKDKKIKSSGVIINTGGWVRSHGYTQLEHVATAFEVNTVLVLDQERLYNDLIRDLPPFVKVVLLPKSGGVVERSRPIRRDARNNRIKEYFYGSATQPLRPHTFDVRFSDVKIVRIGAPPLPDSCLPLGVKANDCKTKIVPVHPNSNLVYHVLSVAFPTTTLDNVLTENVLGFVCVLSVNMDKQTIKILSPQPKPLPSQILMLMDVQFVDSNC